MSQAQPFIFYGCVEVQELLGYEAHDARELVEQLQKVPEESIFSHTSGFLLHRAVLPEAYPNDFALWAATELRDRRLTERLAMVDPFRSGSMEAVRGELIATIEEHLRHAAGPPPRCEREPFSFLRTHTVPVPTGHQACSLRELRDALAEVDVSALFYHLIESRYRLGFGRGDVVEWVEHSLGRADLADRLAHIDPFVGSLERARAGYLTVLGEALEALGGDG